VVTVGAMRAGSRGNIIPDSAELLLSVRAFDEDVRTRVLQAITRIVSAEAQASGAHRAADVEVLESFPAVVNDADGCATTLAGFERHLGPGRVVDPGAVTGSEDVGLLARAAGVPASSGSSVERTRLPSLEPAASRSSPASSVTCPRTTPPTTRPSSSRRSRPGSRHSSRPHARGFRRAEPARRGRDPSYPSNGTLGVRACGRTVVAGGFVLTSPRVSMRTLVLVAALWMLVNGSRLVFDAYAPGSAHRCNGCCPRRGVPSENAATSGTQPTGAASENTDPYAAAPRRGRAPVPLPPVGEALQAGYLESSWPGRRCRRRPDAPTPPNPRLPGLAGHCRRRG
jgi:hypothetical protein